LFFRQDINFPAHSISPLKWAKPRSDRKLEVSPRKNSSSGHGHGLKAFQQNLFSPLKRTCAIPAVFPEVKDGAKPGGTGNQAFTG